MSVAPTLENFTDFFGVAPAWVAPEGWCYGARFVVQQGTDELTITIAPDELELDIAWRQSGATRLTLALRMVVMWLIERNGSKEQLLVRINTGPEALCAFEYCLVRLRPAIEVECRMKWGPGEAAVAP